MGNPKNHKNLKIAYTVTTTVREVSVSIFRNELSDHDISSCIWGSDDLTEMSMVPVTGHNWSIIEEYLGHGVNDNYIGNLPHTEIRFFVKEKESITTTSNKDEASIRAIVKIEEC